MFQPSISEEALTALAAFKAYAAGTLLVLDLIGTFVFALSGGVAGVKERLDLFGVLVLSFAAASAGGIMRDLLIGAVPPAAISDWCYLGVSLFAGLIIFFWYPVGERLPGNCVSAVIPKRCCVTPRSQRGRGKCRNESFLSNSAFRLW
jgi:hypothetical protein